ncbi:SusD/RagB family nutrient-binding outer membrane lipoprotein [Hymenobacter saemangeumensis]|uniref:SusD/RagB family nutrient-binding outer membrane lipoprotein n=1 Tax=Hymenobacter saemangeumensis TaxID=1084522 RepID=A0ABP8HX61_9BACT
MKKLLLTALSATLLLSASSCVDSLDDYNIDTKNPTKVPASTLFSNAERNLGRTMASSSVNLNVFRLYVQYWAQTTYFDESIYDINTRAINTNFWSALYRDVLRDLQEAKTLASADILTSNKTKANQLAAIEVLEVYTWMTLVDTFGDIPYSQALNIDTPQPKYDDDAAIYADLATRLDRAIAALDASGDSFGDADLIYHGDVASWKMFANSLKLRMALTIADVDDAKARTMAQQAAPNVFTSNDDNAQLNFLSTSPSTNPVWEDLVQSGRKDYVGANTFINRLTSLNDPRLPVYFKMKPMTMTYVGGVYGTNNNYNSFSAPGAALEDPTLPGVLLSYTEVEFLLAEAAARTYSVGGTPASHYNAAVTASIQQWGGSAAQAAAYLAQPSVAYATAAGTYKQKIGNQKWIALYNQPVEAWKEYRRLDAPALVKPTQARTDLPLRFTYPVNEQNLNTANYTAAASAMGGDLVTSKVFWDRF